MLNLFFISWGTKIFGRKNLTVKEGKCSFCGRNTKLKTYVGTKWFVLYYIIPIIPLGRKQIIDHCPECDRCRMMPYSNWKVFYNETVKKNQNILENEPNNVKALIALIDVFTISGEINKAFEYLNTLQQTNQEDISILLFIEKWYQDNNYLEKADEIGERIYIIGKDNPDVALKRLNRLSVKNIESAKEHALNIKKQFADNLKFQFFLGDWFKSRKMNYDAIDCYKNVLTIEFNKDAELKLAELYITEKKLQDAEYLLINENKVITGGEYDIHYKLAQAFENEAQAERAFSVYRIIYDNFVKSINNPSNVKKLKKIDPNTKTLIKQIEKKINVKKSIIKTNYIPVFAGISIAIFWVIIISLIAFGNNYLKNHQTLYIVNQLHSKAIVKIGDVETNTYPAGSFYTTKIPEGRYKVLIKIDKQDEIEEYIEIKNNFFDRFFNMKVNVLNVYGVGFVIWEEVKYSINPDPNEKMPYEIFIGKTFFTVDNVNYRFKEFPEELKLEDGKPKIKTGINLYPMEPEMTVNYLLSYNFSNKKIIKYIEAQLISGYKSDGLVNSYLELCKNNNILEYGERFLEDNFILIN